MNRLRFLCLFCAILLYGFASSPTPNHPGLIEAVIGVLLCIVALPGAWHMVRYVGEMRNLWQGAGAVLMLYGLSVPLCAGLMIGQDFVLILRDVVPFLFMGLALFAGDLFVGRSDRFRLFLWGAVGLGLVQAVRALLPLTDFAALGLGRDFFSGVSELYYLANSPFVLCAALLCIAGAVQKLTADGCGYGRRFFTAGALLVVAALPLGAMALTLQRAGLGYAALYVLVLVGLAVMNRPRRALVLLLPVVGVGLFAGAEIFAVFEALFQKTQSRGLNMRVEEWRSVWQLAQHSWLGLFFGQGWGMAFESPAVSGVRVNFTHSLFSSMILKAGLFGAVLTLLYVVGLLQMLWAQLQCHQILALALLGPFLIDVLFYATFKSLDFGLLVLLIPAGIVAGGAPVLETRRNEV